MSLINVAGDCATYGALKSKLPEYSKFVSRCERPVAALSVVTNGYIDYGLCLCMVLYEVAQRVCEMKKDVKQINEVIDVIPSVVCEEMNKILSELSSEAELNWISFLKANFENSSNCELACLQGNVTNPLCLYILKGSTLAMTSKKGEFFFYFYPCTRLYECLAACLIVYGAELTFFLQNKFTVEKVE
jgi:hypothetical protein